jgi:hypothetical protein
MADIYQTARRRNSEGRCVSTNGTTSDITNRLMLLERYLSVFLQSNKEKGILDNEDAVTHDTT